MRNRLGLSLLLLFLGSGLFSQPVVLPPGFVYEQDWVLGVDQPTDLKFAPDGRIFVTEKTGAIRIIDNGVLLDQPFYVVQTQTPYERGVESVVLDPDFDNNGYVYIYHTLPYERKNRLIRVTANGNTAAIGSEVELLKFDEMHAAFHNGGSMVFDTTGCLLIAVGDGVTGGPPDLNYLLGKMLRIRPDGTIPTDNPFYNVSAGIYRSVAAYGIRNPYTMAISKTTGRVFFNDVGNDAWEEVNEYHPGRNYGWYYVEGPLGSGTAPDSNYTDPIYAYDHAYGCAVVGAAFYEPEVPTFPSYYHGRYFFLEYCKGYLLCMDPDSFTVEEFATGLGYGNNNIETGPDGSLYIINVLSNKISRLSYQGINGPPVISVQPKASALVPGESLYLEVVANGEGLNYKWYRNGTLIQNSARNNLNVVAVTMADSGARYHVLVEGAYGQVSSDTVALVVINGHRPEIDFVAIPQTYIAGDSIPFRAIVRDQDQPVVDSSQWAWEVYFHHDEHRHPTLPLTQGISQGGFRVEDYGEVDTNVHFRIHLHVLDNSGLDASSYFDVRPELVTMRVGSTPPGVVVSVDGKNETTDFEVRSLLNLRRTLEVPEAAVVGDSLYQFVTWADNVPDRRRTFPARNSQLGLEYRALAAYFTGVSDTGRLTVFRDTSELQVFYREHPVTEIKKNWDYVSPYPFDQPVFPADYWSARWEGKIYPPITGTYTFYLLHDGHVKLRLQDSLVRERRGELMELDSFQLDLVADSVYSLQLDYNHLRYMARVELDWRYSIVGRHPVPFMTSPATNPPQPDLGRVIVFPNPSSGTTASLWVDSADYGSSWWTMHVYDLAGRLRLQNRGQALPEVQSFDVSSLEPGIYVIRLTVGVDEYVLKFLRN